MILFWIVQRSGYMHYGFALRRTYKMHHAIVQCVVCCVCVCVILTGHCNPSISLCTDIQELEKTSVLVCNSPPSTNFHDMVQAEKNQHTHTTTTRVLWPSVRFSKCISKSSHKLRYTIKTKISCRMAEKIWAKRAYGTQTPFAIHPQSSLSFFHSVFLSIIQIHCVWGIHRHTHTHSAWNKQRILFSCQPDIFILIFFSVLSSSLAI